MIKWNIIILIGISGSGKTELKNHAKNNEKVIFIVSTTSRTIRQGEINGISYYFVTKEEFQRMIAEDKFVEYFEYSGNYYGISKSEIKQKAENNKTIVHVMEINGALKIKELFPGTKLVFVKVPILKVIFRMFKRGDSLKNIAKRIINILKIKETQNYRRCDFVINNKSLENAYQQLDKIIEEN